MDDMTAIVSDWHNPTHVVVPVQGYHPDAQTVILIDGLEQTRTAAQLTNMIRNYDADRASTRLKIKALEEYLTENYDTLGANVLEDLCQMFELDLSKDIEVTVTVTFTANVNVPINEVDDFNIGHYEIDATLDSLGDYDFDCIEASVDSIDYEIS